MTADRTDALEAAQIVEHLKTLKINDSGFLGELGWQAAKEIERLLSTAKEADRMRTRLEILAQSIERTAYDCMVGRDNADQALDQVAYRIRAALLPSEGTKTCS